MNRPEIIHLRLAGTTPPGRIADIQRATRDGTWDMESYTDDPDKLTVNITTCANVELFGELGVPELGRFGFDHDLAGYPAIEDDVNCEFRRLCTIARGDESCIFEFDGNGCAVPRLTTNVVLPAMNQGFPVISIEEDHRC